LSKNQLDDSNLTISTLFDQFEAPLYRYATGLARDPDRADDLVQETLIRAMAHLALLGQLSHYQRRAWLFRVLRNVFLDQQRARQRRQNLLAQLIHEAETVSRFEPIPALYEILEIIPEQYREVLERRYLWGMTSEEIGRELEIPAATVRSRFRLARKWLNTHRAELV
jgi:RNA polymerase sigma-70 factor (ECF subfamily)